MDETNTNQNQGPGITTPSERPPMTSTEAEMFAGGNISAPAPVNSNIVTPPANESILPHAEIKQPASQIPMSTTTSVGTASTGFTSAPVRKKAWPKVVLAVIIVLGIVLAYEYMLYISLPTTGTSAPATQ